MNKEDIARLEKTLNSFGEKMQRFEELLTSKTLSQKEKQEMRRIEMRKKILQIK